MQIALAETHFRVGTDRKHATQQSFWQGWDDAALKCSESEVFAVIVFRSTNGLCSDVVLRLGQQVGEGAVERFGGHRC